MKKSEQTIDQLLRELKRLKKQVSSYSNLQMYEAKYRNLVEKASEGIAIIQNKACTYINPHLAEMLGYNLKEIIHKPFTDFIHQDELQTVVDRHTRRLAGEEVPTVYESAIKTSDGRKISVEFNVNHILYLGKPTTFLFVRDITERKNKELIRTSVYRISEVAYSTEDLQEFYQTIHDVIAELMPAKNNFYIALFDESTEMLHFPYFVDEEEENPGPQKLGDGLTEYVFRTGRSLLASPKVFLELEKKGEVKSIGPPSIDWLGVPLKIGGKTIGVLTVQSYTDGVRYTEEEKDVLTFIAEQVAMAIERKQTTQALRKSEKQIRALIEAIPASIYFKDTQGKNLVVNKAFEELVGKNREEIIGKTDKELLPKILATEYNKSDDKVFKSGEVYHGEEKHLNQSGEISYFDTIKAPIVAEQGEIVGLVGVSRDITMRKKTEEALKQSEEKYKTIAENIDVGIYRTTSGANGHFIEANPAIVRMFGYKNKQEFLKVDVSKFYRDPKGRKSFQKKMLREGFVKNEEVLLKKKNGKPFLGSICAVTVRDEKGKIRYFDGIVEDITDRKDAEEKLKNSLLEKEVLLREIHHRVKNNLQIISSLLNLQSRHVEDEPALDMFQESRNRVRSMALVHEKLYRSNDLAEVDFCEYIQSLGRHLFMSYGINSTEIDLNVDVKDVFLDINTSIPCGLIINELVSNSLKHAFSGRARGKIHVAMRPENNGKFKMVIRDDGVGLPKNLEVTQTKSLGLQLVTMLVEQLQGTLSIENKKGTSFEIVFEKLDYRARR